MMKILTYIIGTVLINGIVIGASYWRMLDNLGWWIRGKVEGRELFGFYDELSWLQIAVIGVCELVLALILIDRSTEEQEIEDMSSEGQKVSDHSSREP